MADRMRRVNESVRQVLAEALPELKDPRIGLVTVTGTITAMDNVCLHRGGPLGQGLIDKGKVVCPWHGWAWDPRTGEAAHAPAAKLAVYPLKMVNGEVWIEI